MIEGLDEFVKIANSHIHLYGKDTCRPWQKDGTLHFDWGRPR